jgi:hypothetical protein
MKRKTDKELMWFVVLIPLFLWGSFYILSRMDNKLPDYSTVNKSNMGCSVFFETLKELKYPIDKTIEPVDSCDVGDIQIVTEGDKFDVNSEEIKSWVQAGGILIYLTNGRFNFIDYGKSPEVKSNIILYKYNKGMVINAEVSDVTNKMLTKKTSNAYELLKEIDSHPYKKIYFNEAHLYSVTDEKSLWDYIPIELKYIIYQLIIVIMAFFYYKGKRFGKIVPLYEEVERIENEYLYSAAALYRVAKCSDLILDNYYKDFLKQMNRTDENWLEYWKQQKLPSENKAKKIYEFMHRKNKKSAVKEYVQMVTILEQLSCIVKKRRDEHWKILKR